MTLASMAPSGLVGGEWTIDRAHSVLCFTVRHMGLFRIRGCFTQFGGTCVVAPDLEKAAVVVEVDMASVNTRDANRDGHLRSSDFFDVARYPRATFRSTGLHLRDNRLVLAGILTIKDVTRPFELVVEALGVVTDPMGKQRAGFLAEGELSRADFGITFNLPMPGNQVVIGDKVTVNIEIQAVLGTEASIPPN